MLAGIVIALLALGYYGYKAIKAKDTAPAYITAIVTKGSLTVAVSGTGQVSASNQIDLKPKVAGEITYVGAQNGQAVKTGDMIARLDSRDAQKAVRDAQSNLDSAQLSLQKLVQPADELAVLQSENSLARAKESKQNSGDSLNKAYEDGFTAVSNAFLDLPDVMSGLKDILYAASKDLGAVSGQANLDFYQDAAKGFDSRIEIYRDDADAAYQKALAAYNQNFSHYKAASRFSDTTTIQQLIGETYEASKLIAEAVKDATNFIQFYKDTLNARNVKPKAAADAHITGLNSYTGTTNSHLLSLFSIQSTLTTSKQAMLDADRLIAEKQAALANLKTGADPLDIQSSKLSVQQRQNALLDAREKLADYTLRAPLDGIVAKVSAKKGDVGSSGSVMATLITKQQVVEIALNEVDVSKIKVGQKASLNFDALEGLTITGFVGEIDSIGTVTQGVVNYSVKIIFDTQDDRIKSGMSVSANIIINVRLDALLVPNSAIKSQGNSAYVEILTNGKPAQNPVTVGAANDVSTEVTAGLSEGQQIITQTINSTPSAAQSATQTRSGGGLIPGLGGGGMFRGAGGGR